MKAVELLVNSVLPADLRGERTLDKKSLDRLMADIAQKYPDRYTDLSKAISDIGRQASYIQGETVTLADMRPPFDKKAVLDQMDQELDKLGRSGLSGKSLDQAKLEVFANYADQLEKLTKTHAQAKGNNLASAVISGARGNATQLKAMITTPALYEDYKGRAIPLFVRRSFGEGLRPAEYLASTFGVRKSVISTKAATAKAGDVGKQLQQAVADVIVTEDDCGSTNGIDVELDDPELTGRVLARSYGGVKAGTAVDKKALSELRRQGVKSVLARSPLTCQSHHGVCAHDVGLLPSGHFPAIGESVGMTSAQSVAEPLAQGSLNTKHTGGAFRGKKQQFSGFAVLNEVLQSPENFPYKAAIAEVDGKVHKIEDAPQGGKYIFIGDQKHYALPGYDVLVHPGDEVEAGDTLSEGLIDAADIARLRGLGEARQAYVKQLKQVLEDSGVSASKRNLEAIARGTLDHVRIEDPDGLGHFLPDDLASYNTLSSQYSPPKDAAQMEAKKAVGHYLQQPALHYTIGTRITPRIAKHLTERGMDKVLASPNPPGFLPEMARLRGAQYSGEDWLAKMHTSFLGPNLKADAARGRDTNVEHNVHFAPRLMVGQDFGKRVNKTGEF